MKQKELFFQKVILTIFVLCFFVTTSWADNNEIVIKLATLPQKGLSITVYVEETFLAGLTKAAEGQVKFDVYWGGVMGDEEDYIGKMRTGQLQGAFVSASGGITNMICPDLCVLSLPFLFNAWAWDEVNYVKNKIREHLYKEAEKRGYKILILINADFDQIYSTKQNIATIEDIKAAKFLTWYGPLENKVLQSLGVSPIPVNVPEVVSSIKTGIADMVISPTLWWVGAQLYPDTKYVNPLPIRFLPMIFVVTNDVWNEIPEKHRKAMEALFPKSETGLESLALTGNKKAYNAMLNYGLKEVKVKPEELARFKNATRSVWDELAGKSYSREFLDEVIGHLDDYRKNKQT